MAAPFRTDLTGIKFGRLKVFEHGPKRKGKPIKWFCRCDCGNVVTVAGGSLRSGSTRSCGCLRKEATAATLTTHGLSGHPLYRVWQGMKQRCYNVKNTDYKHHGGRGITVCGLWFTNFENFHYWALENGYKKGLIIDRKDDHGPYSPTNCRWADKEAFHRRRQDDMFKKTGYGYCGVRLDVESGEWEAYTGDEINGFRALGTFTNRIDAITAVENFN